jgi:hypothetical protein
MAALLAGALMLALVPASPANAAVGATEAVGVGQRGRAVQATCVVTGVLIGLDRIQLSVNAEATATPDGLATRVQCTASSAAGGSVSTLNLRCPGPACATTGTGSVSLGKLTVCVNATGTFGPLNPEDITVSNCHSGVFGIEFDT